MNANNIATALFEIAASQPDTLAIALPAEPGKPLPKSGPVPYHKISFKELANETNCISRGLLASGFKPGERVVLMVPPSVEFFSLIFAFLQSGIIPVLIDPGIGIKNLKKCIGEAKPVGFIGITKAHVARVLLGWGRSTIKKRVTIGSRLFWGGRLLKKIKDSGRSDAPAECFAVQPDDLASISFTSGSTGIPKGVMSTHGNIHHQVEIIRRTYHVRPGEIDLPTFPPFALLNAIVGMGSIIPDMDPTRPASVDPERIIRVMDQFKVTSMFGSPALIDRVGRYGEANNVKLPSLKRVFSAGAPVSAKALRRFSAMLNPTTQIFTPYGATESMPVASIGSHEILKKEVQQRTESGGGICIGKPVDTLEAQVIRITDEPISFWSEELKLGVGEIGEIVVKGKNVTQAYFNRDVATKSAKIKDGDSIWHRMGDLGYKDAEGNLWFCGRKAHIVKLDDKELYSVQCESIFNKHPQVHRTALVGVRKKAVLCVEVDKYVDSPNRGKIKKELLEWAAGNELTKDIQTILFHPSFPVDIRHNAKIFREKLAVWAATQ
ncbi:fatty acid CoA ligase family protein [bacterium]|nr:fatty acid CoA ligase family protein [bacterium]